MPRVFVPPDQLRGEAVTLEGERHRYLARVLRLGPGDPLVIFDGAGMEIEARVSETGPRTTTLALGARRSAPAPQVAITLLQAVAKGERMDLVVQKATELGVTRIVPVLSARSVARPGAEGRHRRWNTIAQEAARQCGRADVPAVEVPCPLAEALAEASAREATRLVLWEGSSGAPLRRALGGSERAVILLVGPEGGLASDEVEAAGAAGFRPVGLGPRILRTETAALVALALVQAALGGLD
jgi:16S rRNA (uracil1498-N3)-methyltransferase